MVKTTFDHVFSLVNDNLICVVPPAKKLPQHRFFDHMSATEKSSSAGSKTESTRAESSAQRKLRHSDIYCFITGSARDGVQAAHLLNALRRTPEGKPADYVKNVKQELENLLTRLEFNRQYQFYLDGRPNLVLLLNGLHHDLDTRGAFAFLPCFVNGEPLKYLRALLHSLKTSNADWSRRYQASPDAKRNLPLDEDVYNPSKRRWIVYVLRKRILCPPGEGLLIIPPEERQHRTESTQAVIGNVMPLGAVLAHGWQPFLLEQPTRAPDEELSLFAMLVNAHSKIAAYENTQLRANERRVGMDGLPELLADVRQAIFFVPDRSLFDAIRVTVRLGAPMPTASIHGTLSSSVMPSHSTTSGASTGSVPPAGDAMEESHENFRHEKVEEGDQMWKKSVACESDEDDENDEDEDEDEDVLHSPEPDVVPGINLAEYEMLLAGGDGTLSSTDIMSMLLFGATGVPKFETEDEFPLDLPP